MTNYRTVHSNGRIDSVAPIVTLHDHEFHARKIATVQIEYSIGSARVEHFNGSSWVPLPAIGPEVGVRSVRTRR
jgi:hypothetical protein